MVRKRHNTKITPETERLMRACDRQRIAMGMSRYQVGVESGVDPKDCQKALGLKEEPTKRTVQNICGYFNISEFIDDRREAMLLEMSYHARRFSELTAEMVEMERANK